MHILMEHVINFLIRTGKFGILGEDIRDSVQQAYSRNKIIVAGLKYIVKMETYSSQHDYMAKNTRERVTILDMQKIFFRRKSLNENGMDTEEVSLEVNWFWPYLVLAP